MSYVHIEKLGGRRNKLDVKGDKCDSNSNNNNGWKNKSFRAYADYMATISFREGVNEKQKNNYIIGYLTFSDEKVVP
jgi:hypothetical protein